MKKISMLLTVFIVVLCLFQSAYAEIVFQEDFEGDWTANWSVDRGTWEVGVPTSGPVGAYSGSKCAATILDGNYAENVDSRFARHVSFEVPPASEHPRLRFWHWYSISGSDYGKVQIKAVGSDAWIDISDQYTSTSSGVWTRPSIDLSEYAGLTVQVAFYFHSRATYSTADVSTGWYVDEVLVEYGPIIVNSPEGWESGLGDWGVSRGTWQVGVPTSGPVGAYSGSQCAATVLGGNYADWVASRLTSPPFVVPAASENPNMRFWHWYSISGSDYGKVQIKAVGSDAWIDISDQYTSTSSGAWTYPYIDLSEYAGLTVQVAFYFYSRTTYSTADVSTGWYVDEVTVSGLGPSTTTTTTVQPTCTDNDGDGYFAKEGCETAVDCDDTDPTINPRVTEVCGDGKDNNCNGVVDEGCPGCNVVSVTPDDVFIGFGFLPRLRLVKIVGGGEDFDSQGKIAFSSEDVFVLASKAVSKTEISALVYIAPRAKTGSFDVSVGDCIGKDLFEIKKWRWQ